MLTPSMTEGVALYMWLLINSIWTVSKCSSTITVMLTYKIHTVILLNMML